MIIIGHLGAHSHAVGTLGVIFDRLRGGVGQAVEKIFAVEEGEVLLVAAAFAEEVLRRLLFGADLLDDIHRQSLEVGEVLVRQVFSRQLLLG